jgi:hypothetical protein
VHDKPDARESSMAQDYIHPLQALRAVMVPPLAGVESGNGQRRRELAETLLSSRKGASAAKRRKKLIKLQREVDVIDDAIAYEQLLSPSLREQVAKECMDEDRVTSSMEPAEPLARLTELSERLTEAGSATVSKRAAR